jgi:serine/threonine-protein kinase
MDALASLTAALADRYAIEREIGRGGMATVYLARDLKHDRRVALKVLDPELGAVLGAARFLAEIKVTANLQHPNLLPLFDSGEAAGLLYYVMPFVDGESLRAKLERERQFPVAEAVRLAVAIAGALDYAHRHGVIHRDLKPENILIHEGQPLVADFGIALAVANAGGARVTQTGLSLGTPQYMSPEQATGDRAIDGRTDIYSLGAVLYEMLTGEPPHTGATAQAIIARVLTETPRSVRAERSSVPEYVDDAIDRALAKLPADRWSTAQEFADALGGKGDAGRAGRAAGRRSSMVSRRLAPAVGFGLVLSALAGAFIATKLVPRPGADSGSGTARFALTYDGEHVSLSARNLATLAVSRDGQLLAAVGSTTGAITGSTTGSSAGATRVAQSMIFVRTMNDPHPRAVEGTRGAQLPFFSPDGKWLGFVVGRRLMKIAVEGGTPIVVGAIEDGNGVAWLTSDQIVMESSSRLAVIPAVGGTPRIFTELNTARGEVEQRWPLALPDGNTVLYASSTGSLPTSRLGVATLSDGKAEILDVPGSAPLGVIDGQLVYVSLTGTLMAVPFDARSRRVTGAPVGLTDRLALGPRGSSNASLSLNGTLVYQTGSSAYQVVIAEPGGHERVLIAEPRPYGYPRLSPDGQRLAVTVSASGRNDVWVYAIAGGTLTRLTSEGTANERAEWSPNGKTVIYRSDASGGSSLWQVPADGSGRASVFFKPPGVQVWEGVFTPDGQTLVYRAGPIGTGDVMYRRMSGACSAQSECDTTPHAIAATKFSEWTPRLSPDGRWVAYASDESGVYQVYVRPFPDGGARYQVSAEGGEMPVWSHDGRRLYFISDREIVAAELAFSPAFSVTRRTKVLEGDFAALSRGHAPYDATPDGSLLLVKALNDSQTMVVLNWADELRAVMAKGARP